MMGEEAAARKSYEEFLTLWKDADADVPIYREARSEYAAIRTNSMAHDLVSDSLWCANVRAIFPVLFQVIRMRWAPGALPG